MCHNWLPIASILLFFSPPMVTWFALESINEGRKKTRENDFTTKGHRPLYNSCFAFLFYTILFQPTLKQDASLTKKKQVLKMDPINYNDESINFDDLLSDGNYPTLWDNLPFSNGMLHQNNILDTRSDLSDLELQDDFNNLLSSLPQLTNDEQPINDVEDIFAGFQNVLEG